MSENAERYLLAELEEIERKIIELRANSQQLSLKRLGMQKALKAYRKTMKQS